MATQILGFETFDHMVDVVGYDKVHQFLNIRDLTLASESFKSWKKGYDKLVVKNQKYLEEDCSPEQVKKWKLDHLPGYLHLHAVALDRYLNPGEYPDDVEEKKEDNIITIRTPKGTTHTAQLFTGDCANNFTLWTPPVSSAFPIRLFIMSLNYGLGLHPGDVQPTSIPHFKAVMKNLKNFTTEKYFTVVVFHSHQYCESISNVMKEYALEQKVQHLVSELISYCSSLLCL